MSDGSSSKVLIVEDDPDIVLALTTLLEDAGYTPMSASDSNELEYLITADPPALLLLDMLLSGRDGREITRRLKEREATRRIPILMLSAHPTAEQEARAAGADGFLAKPFELDDLLGKVAALLR